MLLVLVELLVDVELVVWVRTTEVVDDELVVVTTIMLLLDVDVGKDDDDVEVEVDVGVLVVKGEVVVDVGCVLVDEVIVREDVVSAAVVLDCDSVVVVMDDVEASASDDTDDEDNGDDSDMHSWRCSTEGAKTLKTTGWSILYYITAITTSGHSKR